MNGLPNLTKIIAAAASAVLAGNAMAASLKLDDKQLAEAVEEGKAKYEMHPLAFKNEYYRDLGFGYPAVLLRTEYFAVADYVRRSEFQRKYGSQRVHELNDARIKSAQSEVNGQLQFQVTLYGKTENFANNFKYRLMVGDKAIEPASVDSPQRAESSGFGGKVDFKADVIVDFPGMNLKGNEKITLVIDPPDGMGPSGARNDNYEAKFDLSKLK